MRTGLEKVKSKNMAGRQGWNRLGKHSEDGRVLKHRMGRGNKGRNTVSVQGLGDGGVGTSCLRAV